ncbi:ataxin-1-like [Brachyhypopomus gauderio]|uniref:ataxin-1-like n=1 Tax=Brachyhypopomus gauderio TaxID=698409 RepID=UPI0040429C13
MKPAQERSQECLPPKKRDLPHNNITHNSNSSNSGGGGGGGGNSGGGGEEAASSQSSGASGEPQGGGGGGEWVRTSSSLHYGVEGPESLAGLPMDQYSMLYKVALPSVTYAPTSLHPVLSHISPAYTVPSPLLQHTGIPYPPLGYTPVPHSSLQFVGSPYAAAVPYAVPPGFVPGPLISPQSALPQTHPVSHLVPYPSVIQEGVVSSQTQQPVPAHAFAKVAAPAALPLLLSSEQAAAQHQLGAVGVLPAADLSPRAVPVFYQPGGARAAHLQREAHSCPPEQDGEVNGGERELEERDGAYLTRSVRPPQALPGGVVMELTERAKSRRQDGRVSERSTPDTDLEVQQVVGRLASPVHSASRRDVPHGTSQNSQRSRDVQVEGRTVYGPPLAGQLDLRAPALQHQTVQPGHAVILANGQPVLVPLDYHHHHHHHQQQYPGQPNDSVAAVASPTPYSKASEPASTAGLPERTATESPGQPPPLASTPAPPSVAAPPLIPAPPLATPGPGPSHFMKGAIIQLATGELKRVEDLQTQDFVRSAEASGGLKIDSSMVVDVRGSQQRPGLVALHFTVGEQQSRVTIDVPPEHPFFVFGQGWSSCSPERTAQLYGLACHHLQVGDVCVSVALQQQTVPQPRLPPPAQPALARTPAKANATPGNSAPQPMGPPPPQHPRPPGQLRTERAQRERDREKSDKDEPTQGAVTSGHGDSAPRPNRTLADHSRSYYLHSEGHGRPAAPSAPTSDSSSHRRWSAPGFQRYAIKTEEGVRAPPTASGSSRPSFIPQEVKLSIEGRSNAGK